MIPREARHSVNTLRIPPLQNPSAGIVVLVAILRSWSSLRLGE
jgi:hypothetical protein